MANLTINGTLTATNLKPNNVDVITATTNNTKGIKLSNGLIINWGTVTPSSSKTLTFEVPFSTTSYSIMAVPTNSSGVVCTLGYSSKTTTNFSCRGTYKSGGSGYTSGDVTFKWVAVGR